jgi:hypothetical protein
MLLIAVVALGFLVGIVLVQPSFGQSRTMTSIIVQDADTVREESSVSSSGLRTSIDQVIDRIVLRFADTMREQSLVTIPAVLDAKLDAVEDRIVLRFANTKRLSLLVDTPFALDNLLDMMEDRVVLRFANDMRRVELVYPIGLPPGDPDPPIVTNITATNIDSDSATIVWNTNEYADSRVNYGTSSDNHSSTQFDSDVVYVHEVIISGLSPGTYYYRVESTDRSGNTAVSAEKTFMVNPPTATPTATPMPDTEINVYLPTIVK